MRIEFFMPMVPPRTTAQMHQVTCRGGKPVFFDPPAVVAARSKLTAHLGQHVPQERFGGPVRLVTKWCWPRGAHGDGEWKETRPDTDNLLKLLKDCMTKLGFWTDDAQVTSEITEKFWATVPGIWIAIEELQ
ncbi:MAG: RusA family crossover junction endodeoxyribonuclease [Actinomycetes bacterium]